MAAILTVRGLSKAFGGVTALDEVGFEVAPGERLAVIGPNGAGKSTCFNIIGGQLTADRGTVALAAQEVTGLAPHRLAGLGLARTFQVAAAFGSLSVRENLQAALMARRGELIHLWRPADRYHRARATELLERVGLQDLAEQPCGLLAYGELKRVELAIALAQEPLLLLMDEPTAGMAVPERKALMTLVDNLVGESELAVLFTEHDMDVVFRHADRILVLDRGRVIAQGPPDTVRDHPDVRRVYLGEADRAAAVLADLPETGSC